MWVLSAPQRPRITLNKQKSWFRAWGLLWQPPCDAVVVLIDHVWRTCASVRSTKTATVSPSSPTAEPARGRGCLSLGRLTPPVWVSESRKSHFSLDLESFQNSVTCNSLKAFMGRRYWGPTCFSRSLRLTSVCLWPLPQLLSVNTVPCTTPVDRAAPRPAITGTRSARATNPAWPAATVPLTWCCSRDAASNPHPALAGDLRDAGGRRAGGVEADG